jgi:hypothetical protein
LLGIALGIAIALGAVWVTWRTPSATEADADPTDQPEEVHDAAWSVAPQSEALTIPVAVSPPQRFDDAASGAPSADQPLPPHDTPLTEVIDELESRALRGDRPAACRLAMDGYFCRNNPLDSDSVAFFEQAIASRGRTTAADVAWIERLEAMHRRAVRLCSGLPEGWVRDHSWRYLLQGAQLGDDFLAAMYVIAPPLDRNDFLENPEPWSQYQQHAATLLRRAAEHARRRRQDHHRRRGKLTVPNNPIIPFIEGDGTGPTSGAPACACSMRRWPRPTAASARSTGWRSTPARSRTTSSAPGCRTRPSGLPRLPGLDQGPADHADRRRHPLAERRAAPDARPLRLPAPGALVQGRALARSRTPEKVDMVIFRENCEDIYAGIEFEAGTEANQEDPRAVQGNFPKEYGKIRFPDLRHRHQAGVEGRHRAPDPRRHRVRHRNKRKR